MKASERWTRPVQDWTAALNHFALVFPDRVPACEAAIYTGNLTGSNQTLYPRAPKAEG